MKARKASPVNFLTDEEQLNALRRHASALANASVSWVIRRAISEYLVRHAGEQRPGNFEWRPGRAPGTGKTAPRIMLHLRDHKRLQLLRLQAQALKGTHRTAGRVIRAAIDEYLEAHKEERIEAVRQKKAQLGDESFAAWKRQVQRGPAGEERIYLKRRTR